MHTPTLNQFKSPTMTPLNAPSPQQILQSALIEAENSVEHVSQTLTRAMASPAASSPFYQLKISEALEQVIEGIEPIPVSQNIQPVNISPTAQKQNEPNFKILTSPAPRSPALQKQDFLPNINDLENPLTQFKQLVDVSSSIVEQDLPPLFKQFCFDPEFCGKKAINLCESCAKRTLNERKFIQLLEKIYPNGFKMKDCIDLALIQALDNDIYQFILQTQRQLANYYDISTSNHFKDIFDLISPDFVQNQNSFNDAQRAKFDLKFTNSLLLTPVIFLISEIIFTIPCYVAFSLFPLIRSRYKHLHPKYLTGTEKFINYEILKKTLQINQENQNFYEEENCSINVMQILQFYSDFISEKGTNLRFFNCVKNFNHELQESPISNNAVNFLTESDLILVFHACCKFHPGLEFLRATPDFQVIYAQTVGIRIVFTNDKKQIGRLHFQDFLAGDVAQEFFQLSRSSDVNKLLKYFSYEHFYVIYCQFWQIDSDHDNFVSCEDMKKYGSLTCPFGFKCICNGQNCVCGNVYSSLFMDLYVTRKFSYADFVRFILCEEDKDKEYSIKFFFNIVDLDCDGYINFNDFNSFYQQMLFYGNSHFREVKSPEDMFCQLVDASKHTKKMRHGLNKISLEDIINSRIAGNFFNTMLNFQKLAQFEVKDPYSIKYVANAPEKCQWDRFCRVMYDLMEEGEGDDGADDGLDGGAFE